MQKILTELQNRNSLIKIILSDTKTAEFKKIIIRPILIKNNKVYHENIQDVEFLELMKLVLQEYMQIAFFYAGYTVTFSGSKGKYTKSQSSNNLKEQNLNHNRPKNYILNEGEQIPALVDLGVFNQNYQIIKSKFDKFKQINRFIELIDDSFSKTNLK